ncbi:MAG TPA: hypothetical protein DCK95_05660 [Anaerolineaceae bacterium]|nr:hypothetical protein [Anaerolineaceae bacterium]
MAFDTTEKKPHIVLVVARGEAVRNFLYSDTLPELSKNARVTLLSLVNHGEVIEYVRPFVDQVILLKEYQESSLVAKFRYFVHTTHYRWLWSENAKHMWALHRARATTTTQKIKRSLLEWSAMLFAHKSMLKILTSIDFQFSWWFRPTKDFDKLFRELQPDLVFNCSHIHGPHADLPMRIAKKLGYRIATFVFSWDNLTTRSRIFVPYDHYLMWNERMKDLLLDQYDRIKPRQICITGTPQFDFHFKEKYILPRKDLCKKLGIDPDRPFVLYTTGMDTDFLDEHKFIEEVIKILRDTNLKPKPQLVVRTYIKGTSPEIQAMAEKNIPDVVFPPILWDKQWIMPLREDLTIYSSLLHHCALGINPASTVSLELMALDKPVINIGMEPPGSDLPKWEKFSRHVEYEHYKPVAESGGTMVARSLEDLKAMIIRGLSDPDADHDERKVFMRKMMGNTLDGQSGKRVAECLIKLGNIYKKR